MGIIDVCSLPHQASVLIYTHRCFQVAVLKATQPSVCLKTGETLVTVSDPCWKKPSTYQPQNTTYAGLVGDGSLQHTLCFGAGLLSSTQSHNEAHSTSVSTCPISFPADTTADFSQILGGANVCQDNPSSWQVRLINMLIEAAWWVHRCAVDRSQWVCSFITGRNLSQMLGALRGGSVRSLLCNSWKGMKKCSCSLTVTVELYVI